MELLCRWIQMRIRSSWNYGLCNVHCLNSLTKAFCMSMFFFPFCCATSLHLSDCHIKFSHTGNLNLSSQPQRWQFFSNKNKGDNLESCNYFWIHDLPVRDFPRQLSQYMIYQGKEASESYMLEDKTWTFLAWTLPERCKTKSEAIPYLYSTTDKFPIYSLKQPAHSPLQRTVHQSYLLRIQYKPNGKWCFRCSIFAQH